MKYLKILFIVLIVLLFSCSSNNVTIEQEVNKIAESYVKLVLEIGQYDSGYIDAYWGPEEWQSSETLNLSEFPASELRKTVESLIRKLETVDKNSFDKIGKQRYEYLEKQLLSVKTRIDLLSGVDMSFDEESKGLYDVVAINKGEEYYKDIFNELNSILPGQGNINERIDNFLNEFNVPKGKFDEVYKTALVECRNRASQYIKFPDNENLEIEYVTDKSWSAYNWFKGNGKSLIQVNVEKPISIDLALNFAAHEVYLGHHASYILLESNLYKGRNWVEFSVNPLFSPLNVIFEGLAVYGIYVAFTNEERIKFVKEVLFPIAGLDQSQAERYFQTLELLYNLDSRKIEIARDYLDGNINKEEATESLIEKCLMTQPGAERRIRFFDDYRSFIITYTVGKDMIGNYIERNGGTIDNPDKRWKLFAELLSTPQTPSGLL